MLMWILVLVVVGVLAYVRLAPIDAGAVHQPVTADVDKDGKGYCIRIVDAGEGALGRVDAAMRALPRTSVLAGSVAEGRITYVTRTKWIGFPDFTTVEETNGQIRLYARLRFGASDYGVNRARLKKIMQDAQLA